MLQLSKIIEGWRNHLLPPNHLKELILKVQKERNEICVKCSLYDITGDGCAFLGTQPCCNKDKDENGIKGCGCALVQKQKCLSCDCPLKKWLAVATEEEYIQVNSLL